MMELVCPISIFKAHHNFSFFNTSIIYSNLSEGQKTKHHGVCCFGLGANLFCFFITYCVLQFLGNQLLPLWVSLYRVLLFLPFHEANNMTTAFTCRHLINQLQASDPVHLYTSDSCSPFTSLSISFQANSSEVLDLTSQMTRASAT